MSGKPQATFETKGWASYVTFDNDLDPQSVRDSNAKYLVDKQYTVKVELVEPNKIRASPAEKINAGDYHILLNDLKFSDGSSVSSETLMFGVGSGAGT